jgi:hypothetical protein
VKYDQAEWWRRYFTIDVGEFYLALQRFFDFQTWISSEVSSGRTLDKIVNTPYGESFKRALIGGLKGESFVDNALALFFRDAYGVYVENPSAITARQKEGLALESSIKGVECKATEPTLLSTLRETMSMLKSIYTQLSGMVKEPKIDEEERKRDIDEFSKKPDHSVEVLRSCLQAGLKLLPAYNPATFFITSLLSIPRFYAKRAYGKLESSFEVLRGFNVHIETILEPDVPDAAIKEERAIMGHARGSVGELMCSIVRNIYALYQQQVVQKYFSVRDEFGEYVKQSLGKLKESVVLERFKDTISTLKRGGSTKSEWGCKLTGAEFYGWDFAEIEGLDIKTYGVKLTYSEFVAYIAPQAFLGVAYALPLKEGSKQFKWMCIVGGW